MAGNLQGISVAGGMLRLSQPLPPNSGIQSHWSQDSDEDRWIAKYRSALIHSAAPRRKTLNIVLGSVAFGMLLVVSAACVVHLLMK
jgi:hypothetical protein